MTVWHTRNFTRWPFTPCERMTGIVWRGDVLSLKYNGLVLFFIKESWKQICKIVHSSLYFTDSNVLTFLNSLHCLSDIDDLCTSSFSRVHLHVLVSISIITGVIFVVKTWNGTKVLTILQWISFSFWPLKYKKRKKIIIII